MNEVETVDMTGEVLNVNLYYPRIEENVNTLRISLYDVRAANDIVLRYDFDRDGWSILSNLNNPDIPQECEDCEGPEELHEVSFIPAWPLKKEEFDVLSIYLKGLGEDHNYYAKEAEESGLLAVYNAGLEAGRKEVS